MFLLRLVAGTVGFFAAVAAGIGAFVARRDRTRVPRDVARWIGRLVLPAARITVRAEGAAVLEGAQPCVYVANHQSYLDYAILGSIYPPRTVVLGRASLARIPLVGWLYRRTGNLLVERSARGSRGAALAALTAAVRQGTSVWIFPEGTRNGTPETLLPFHAGAFRVACATGAPIVPIVVAPLAPRTDLRRRRLERRVVHVEVLAPLRPDGRDAAELAHDARERMQAAVTRLARRAV